MINQGSEARIITLHISIEAIEALKKLYVLDVFRDSKSLYKSVCGELANKLLFLNVAANIVQSAPWNPIKRLASYRTY